MVRNHFSFLATSFLISFTSSFTPIQQLSVSSKRFEKDLTHTPHNLKGNDRVETEMGIVPMKRLANDYISPKLARPRHHEQSSTKNHTLNKNYIIRTARKWITSSGFALLLGSMNVEATVALSVNDDLYLSRSKVVEMQPSVILGFDNVGNSFSSPLPLKIPDFNINFPSLSDMSLPSLPEFKPMKMPSLKTPNLKIPEFKPLKMPNIKPIELPNFQLPRLPDFEIPSLPELSLPSLKLPNINFNLPRLNLPDFNFNLPPLTFPEITFRLPSSDDIKAVFKQKSEDFQQQRKRVGEEKKAKIREYDDKFDKDAKARDELYGSKYLDQKARAEDQLLIEQDDLISKGILERKLVDNTQISNRQSESDRNIDSKQDVVEERITFKEFNSKLELTKAEAELKLLSSTGSSSKSALKKTEQKVELLRKKVESEEKMVDIKAVKNREQAILQSRADKNKEMLQLKIEKTRAAKRKSAEEVLEKRIKNYEDATESAEQLRFEREIDRLDTFISRKEKIAEKTALMNSPR